jgi:hypothetical protein
MYYTTYNKTYKEILEIRKKNATVYNQNKRKSKIYTYSLLYVRTLPVKFTLQAMDVYAHFALLKCLDIHTLKDLLFCRCQSIVT